MANTKMTDEMRRELAEKLDQDLDAYLASREKQPYTEGWKEGEWEKVLLIEFIYSLDSRFFFAPRKWNSIRFSCKNFPKKENLCHR